VSQNVWAGERTRGEEKKNVEKKTYPLDRGKCAGGRRGKVKETEQTQRSFEKPPQCGRKTDCGKLEKKERVVYTGGGSKKKTKAATEGTSNFGACRMAEGGKRGGEQTGGHGKQ